MKAILACVVVLAIAASALDLNRPVITQQLVDQLNNMPDMTWEAELSCRFTNTTLKQAMKLMGVLPDWSLASRGVPIKPSISAAEAAAIPDNFDGRTAWPNCPTVGEIRDQANCGSCWAFGAVSAITDRICIQSKGQVNVHISAEDLNSCCGECGYGCEGGYPDAAWGYWVQTGLVSGGNYNSKEGCAPYSLANCDHHCTGKYGPCPPIGDTPPCPSKCQDGGDFDADKHYGTGAYGVSSRTADIQNEIMTKGSVEAAFTVYEDFLTYKSGVYQHKSGQMLGGHAIKLLGWGVDGGLQYWIAANSWNEDWGNKGYFNIKVNDCGINSGIVAGTPKF